MDRREIDLSAKTTLEGTDHVRIVGANGTSYTNLLSSLITYIKGAIANATTTVSGWMSATDKTKLDGITTGATKTRVKGNSEGTYRTGDVNLTCANIGAVPTTRTVNSKALSSDITLSAADVSAVPTTRTVNSKALSSNITLTAADVSAVPTTRTVNSKALSSNITLGYSDVGAAASSHSHSNYVPTTRTVNSKALSSNITLSASDVGAAASSHTHGDITNAGAPSSQVTIANGDKLMIADASDNNKIKSAVAFDGSTTTQCLTKKGTFVSFPSTSHSHAGLVAIYDRTILNTSLNAGEVLEALNQSITAVSGYTPTGVAGFYATGSNNGHIHWAKCYVDDGKLNMTVKNTHTAQVTLAFHVCILYTKNS